MSGENILVVDDNPINLKLAVFTLEGAGYEVRTAGNADQVAEILTSFHPRVILMDIQLPGVDGLELTRRLRTDPTLAEVRIVALTAFAMTGDRERAIDAGCDGYITKPVPPPRLREFVAEQLSNQPTKLDTK